MTSPNLFAVCPHDTARGFDKWAMLNTFVNRRLDLKSRFQPHLNFVEFGTDLEQERFLWAYLNPSDFLKARSRFGYAAQVRPKDRFDAALVIGPSTRTGLEQLHGKRLAAVPGYLFALAKHRLTVEGIDVTLVPVKSYAEVMKALEANQADFGITYNEHFERLAPSARESYSVVEGVNISLSHVISTHPALPAEKVGSLRELLLAAHTNPEGEKLLAELGFSQFEAVDLAPFDRLAEIL